MIYIPMQTIKDWHLVLFVVFLVGIDVTILTITAAIPSLRLTARLVPNQEKLFEESRVSVLYYKCIAFRIEVSNYITCFTIFFRLVNG